MEEECRLRLASGASSNCSPGWSAWPACPGRCDTCMARRACPRKCTCDAIATVASLQASVADCQLQPAAPLARLQLGCCRIVGLVARPSACHGSPAAAPAWRGRRRGCCCCRSAALTAPQPGDPAAPGRMALTSIAESAMVMSSAMVDTSLRTSLCLSRVPSLHPSVKYWMTCTSWTPSQVLRSSVHRAK